jgi:hypothetical protein
MRNPVILSLLCLSLFLLILPLGVGKPGLPISLKADEPAYYLAAMSLAKDGDLRCDTTDLGRLFDEFPQLVVFNLILMTDDNWQTVYFGKPFIYSLFSAPAVWLFGSNGMVAFNMALLLGMIWMGTSYLREFNQPGPAALYAAGFFLLSSAFSYVFWLHPEIFNMATVTGSLYLIAHTFDKHLPATGRIRRLSLQIFNSTTRPAWSGSILALGIYNKPVLAALTLPILFILWRQRHLRGVRPIVIWISACALTMVVLGAVAVSLAGHPSAYFGVERRGVPVFDPQQMPEGVQPPLPAFASTSSTVSDGPAVRSTQNSWNWIIRIPDIDISEIATSLGYFVWGRHTGLVLYTPFAVLSLLLFLLHNRRSAESWLLLGSLVVIALFFIIWIPFNWHRGGGFIGNRYFVMAYPAFLFLVTRLQPLGLTVGFYGLGGLILGPLLFTPFGAPVPEPTLQAHVRGAPFRFFPIELNFRDKLPGYRGAAASGVWFQGRKDVFQSQADDFWIHGATPVELWMFSNSPLADSVQFIVKNFAPRNAVRFTLTDATIEHRFQPTPSPNGESVRLTLHPGKPDKILREKKRQIFAYRLLVETQTGFIPNAARNFEKQNTPSNDFYLGAALTYLGEPREFSSDHFTVGWGSFEAPQQVESGVRFSVLTHITNLGNQPWPHRGPTRVALSYHWLDLDENVVTWEGRRTDLEAPLQPGQSLEISQRIVAPNEPGDYLLQIDPVRENVAWFSERNDQAILVIPISVGMAEPKSTEGTQAP